MKKIILSLLIFTTFLCLTGCITEITCDKGYQYDEKHKECVLQKLSHQKIIHVENHSEEYEFTKKDLSIYYVTDNEGVPYVKIHEFVYVMNESLLPYRFIENDSSLDVGFELGRTEDNSIIEVLFEFNYSDKSITIDYFNTMGMINQPGKSKKVYSTFISDYSVSGAKNLLSINLDDYGIDMIERQGDVFIPLYLANFLLTGDKITSYESEDSLVVLDSYTSPEEFILQDDSMPVARAGEETTKFLKLIFDHFYGMKYITQEDDYSSYVDGYNLDKASDYEEYYQMLSNLIVGLDDAHTRLYHPGKALPIFKYDMKYDEGSRLGMFYEAKKRYQCDDRDEEFVITSLDDGTVVVELNKFLTGTVNVSNQLQGLPKGTDVVFDLTCNTGGYLQSTMELLAVVSRQPLDLIVDTPQSGMTRYYTYDTPTEKAIDGNYTFYVSPVTYSAANFFTYYVQQNDIGTVIGEKTSGGACPVKLTVLPDGSFLLYSGNMIIIDDDGNSIEYGIEPDTESNVPFDANNLK